jgi:hypothetical protein
VSRDPPASYESEKVYFDYFGWPYYWSGSQIWGNAGKPIPQPHFGQTTDEKDSRHHWQARRPDALLHHASSLMLAGIEALDGESGFVEDIIIDTETWAVHRVVANLASWWPLTESVLLNPQNVGRFNWKSKRLEVALRREELRLAPRFNPEYGVNEDSRTQRTDYYGRPAFEESRYAVPPGSVSETPAEKRRAHEHNARDRENSGGN